MSHAPLRLYGVFRVLPYKIQRLRTYTELFNILRINQSPLDSKTMTRLSQTTQTLYAELLHQLAVTLPNLRGISFCTKTVSGNRYWYMEIVVGSTKKWTPRIGHADKCRPG